MNFSVDPCQDFFQFTCGRFLEESRIADDKVFGKRKGIFEFKLNFFF